MRLAASLKKVRRLHRCVIEIFKRRILAHAQLQRPGARCARWGNQSTPASDPSRFASRRRAPPMTGRRQSPTSRRRSRLARQHRRRHRRAHNIAALSRRRYPGRHRRMHTARSCRRHTARTGNRYNRHRHRARTPGRQSRAQTRRRKDGGGASTSRAPNSIGRNCRGRSTASKIDLWHCATT